MAKNKKSFLVNKLFNEYKEVSKKENAELLKDLDTSINGLNEEEAESRYDNYYKTHKEKSKESEYLKLLLSSFINPFSLILIAIGVLTFLTDVILTTGSKSYFTIIIIAVIIVFSGLLHFLEEYKQLKDTKKLLELVSNKALVIRDNKEIEVETYEVVKGDIIKLSGGDIIPGDIRILESKDLFINESSLTGESLPIEKHKGYKDSRSIIELNNICFMGSNVISGTMKGVVINVKKDTYFGTITENKEKREKTTFEKNISSISKLLVIFMLILIPIVFLINGFTKNNWLEAFIFALTVSIGLTPELLPMIVTTCLASGSKRMKKEEVIVKNLNAINNFGSIDILCMDKTGTITENASKLDKIYNFKEINDEEIVKIAILNSYFQTGLKNPLDKAIIEKFNSLDINKEEYLDKFIKIDEVPFDFKRKRLTTILKNKDTGEVTLVSKGSVEEMLEVSSYTYNESKEIVELTKERKEELIDLVNKYNLKGYRVLLLGIKKEEERYDFGIKDEKDLVLLGMLMFIDPLKDTTKSALNELKRYGVTSIILTGDNEKVTLATLKMLEIDNPKVMQGSEVNKYSEEEFIKIAPSYNAFCKLTPDQKEYIVECLKKSNHKVGFMGDGINDALALKKADIGISVNDACDIAKESADIILLKNDLNVLRKGIREGRKTHFNMMKYIKITASSNFGNMFSLIFASIFLPFLPMEPEHILILNLLYDLICTFLSFDNIDNELLYKPINFNIKSTLRFILVFGPISSIFDIITFLMLYYVLIPNHLGYSYSSTLSVSQMESFKMLLQTGWFILSLITQVLVILSLRSYKSIFKSNVNRFIPLVFIISFVVMITLTYLPINYLFKFKGEDIYYYIYLAGVVIVYILFSDLVKKIYFKKYQELL